MKWSRLAVAAVAAALLAQAGHAQSTAPDASTNTTSFTPGSATPTTRMSGREMLNAVVQPVQQQLGASLQAGVGLLFNRLFNALGVSTGPAASAAAPGAASSPGSTDGTVTGTAAAQPPMPVVPVPVAAAAQPPMLATPDMPPAAAQPSTPAAPAMPPAAAQAAMPAAPAMPPAAAHPPTLAAPAAPAGGSSAAAAGGSPAIVPSVVYALDRVDPATFATIGSIDLSQGAPVLHTGDVFAIRYSTNVPGQVRIDNVDSAGVTNSLGTYTVLPGRDNRIPVTKGIQLTGVTGTEQFKMYFYPCAPIDPSTGTASSGAAAGLPPCSGAANPKLALASKRLVQTKSATNLESPDPTIAVAATANYRPNDVTENDFALQHMPRQ